MLCVAPKCVPRRELETRPISFRLMICSARIPKNTVHVLARAIDPNNAIVISNPFDRTDLIPTELTNFMIIALKMVSKTCLGILHLTR